MAIPRPLPLLLCTALLCGCGPASTSQLLIGKWEGRPDSLAAKRERNPIPTAPGYIPREVTRPVSAEEKEAAEKLAAMQPSEQTDLEAFNFTVLLEFLPQDQVVMSLNGGQPIKGSWKVLSTDVGVSLIELVDGVPTQAEGDDLPQLTKRRFLLELNDLGDAFTLREEGVDPRFGWLYFQRLP
ncbi:hypothetical protein KOR34_44360 [Posidoniimonas corsicana]|uniref:Lipoprotein n=1 Tax=Posidoniimonas corsicana TaxID=1938618 RepID=A0A5C5V000_9BACT|nr:hypothetical protein [Posidoniimonas corsicana]TWT31062.1 hypothetical protein KOR34_44360 [Posidoniimonas corsicana]